MGGIAVPIAGVTPTSVTYPAAWDLPDNPVDVEVWAASAAASPFVPGFQVSPARPTFSFGPPPGTGLIAIHQDFSSLVTDAKPAQPGEYIHFYAADLGPVIPAPPAGLPAPLQPLAQLAVPISCTVGADTNPSPVPVNVAFAGLAPGLLNVFQLDVQMPNTFQGSPSRLSCDIGYPSLGYVAAGLFAVQ